jgi:hypothetical protein
MLGSSRVAAQLAASQEGLSSMSEHLNDAILIPKVMEAYSMEQRIFFVKQYYKSTNSAVSTLRIFCRVFFAQRIK